MVYSKCREKSLLEYRNRWDKFMAKKVIGAIVIIVILVGAGIIAFGSHKKHEKAENADLIKNVSADINTDDIGKANKDLEILEASGADSADIANLKMQISELGEDNTALATAKTQYMNLNYGESYNTLKNIKTNNQAVLKQVKAGEAACITDLKKQFESLINQDNIVGNSKGVAKVEKRAAQYGITL